MKIVHVIENIRTGGAAVATIRLHEACLKAGIDSSVFYREGTGSAAGFKRWELSRAPAARIRRCLGRFRQDRWHKGRTGMQTTFTPPYSEADPREIRGQILKADLVNIHLTGSSFGTEVLLEALPSGFPAVLTFHDQEGITGGCHYAGDCTGYLSGCHECPQVDRSQRRMVERRLAGKAQVFGKRQSGKTALVAISSWQKSVIEQSPLANNARLRLIHHGLDEVVFNPDDREAARRALGFDEAAKVVLFGAAQNGDPRKGMQFMDTIVAGLRHKNLNMVSFGDQPVDLPAGIQYLHLGNLQTEHLRAVAYKAADVFISTAMEEAFGLTVLEALACGTPVAGFKVGGLLDMVTDGVNGFLVMPGETGSFAAAVNQLLNDVNLCRSWAENSRPWLRKSFSYTTMGNDYRSLYESLLAE